MEQSGCPSAKKAEDILPAEGWPLEKRIEFHMREYDALREEICNLDQAKRSLQLYTVGGIAAMSAWLFTNREKLIDLRPAWLLPLFVAIMGFLLSRGYVKATKEMGAYIEKVENIAAHSKLGWEKTISFRRQDKGSLISKIEAVIWAIIFFSDYTNRCICLAFGRSVQKRQPIATVLAARFA